MKNLVEQVTAKWHSSYSPKYLFLCIKIEYYEEDKYVRNGSRSAALFMREGHAL